MNQGGKEYHCFIVNQKIQVNRVQAVSQGGKGEDIKINNTKLPNYKSEPQRHISEYRR